MSHSLGVVPPGKLPIGPGELRVARSGHHHTGAMKGPVCCAVWRRGAGRAEVVDNPDFLVGILTTAIYKRVERQLVAVVGQMDMWRHHYYGAVIVDLVRRLKAYPGTITRDQIRWAAWHRSSSMPVTTQIVGRG